MIQDFPCGSSDGSAEVMELIRKEKLPIPQIYTEKDWITAFAKLEKEGMKKPFCTLPFDHTLEAEAMGGRIEYGNEVAGPRAKAYICQSIQELADLPNIHVKQGRVRETLEACQALRDEGHEVVFQISGPFTIWNTLMDLKYIGKAIRKEPDEIERLLNRTKEDLLYLMEEAMGYGVRLFSYADSVGTVSILGPKTAAKVTEVFTYDFLRRAEQMLENKGVMILCPKTTYALIGMEFARMKEMELPKVMTYAEGCLHLLGRAVFAGQMCMNQQNRLLAEKKIQTLVWSEHKD